MKLSKLLLLCAVVLTTVACGKIPEAYRGKFEDREQGAKLELTGTEGKLETKDGRVLESKAEDMSFEALSEGKQGIFVSTNPSNENMVDVFWVNPNLASKQAVEGFVWYQSEVIYTVMDTKREEKVPNIHLIHCRDGMVMLDMATKRMQLGCPEGPINYNMIRIAE